MKYTPGDLSLLINAEFHIRKRTLESTATLESIGLSKEEDLKELWHCIAEDWGVELYPRADMTIGEIEKYILEHSAQ